MDFRQLKNDAYGIGQRRGMSNSGGGGGGGGLGLSSNFGGGSNFVGNFGGMGGGGGSGSGYGGNNRSQNQSPDSGNFNRSGGGGGGFNNRGFNGPISSSNNYSRSMDDRSSFNQNNQRFGNTNDDFTRRGEDNFRGQGSNFGSSNRGQQSDLGQLARLLDQETQSFGNRNNAGNSGGNFGQDNQNYRGQQSQRFFNDEPMNQGSFGGGNNSGSFGGNNGGNDNFNDNFRGQQSQNFGDQRSGLNDNYGRGGNNGGNFGQNAGNFGGQNFGNAGNNFQGDIDNSNNRGSGGYNNTRGSGFNNSGASGGFNNSGASGGFNNGGVSGGFNNAGVSGGFNNAGVSGGFNSSSNSGFSNNISRTFQEANSRNNPQNSGYQKNNSGGGGGGNGGAALSAWEASQRAYNSKRNQLQKVNLNNGGAIRKPGQQPAVKAVQNIRNNPKATAAIVNATGRNSIPNSRSNTRGPNLQGKPAGGPNQAPIPAPNKYKLVNVPPKPGNAGVAVKKAPVAGQPARTGPQTVKAGPQGVKPGPQAVKTGAQAVKTGPQAMKPGAQAPKPGPKTGPPAVKPGAQAVKTGPATVFGDSQLGKFYGQFSSSFDLNHISLSRVAPPPPQATEAATKSEKKWRRVARKRGFLMGGFKMPYLNEQPRKIPQPEVDSYAVAFFEQPFNYSTNEGADDEDFSSAAVVLNEDSDDEATDDAKSARKIGKRNRKRIRTEWAPHYESKKYKDWATWWKDYKNVGDEIKEQLQQCGNLNLEHCFLPNLPKLTTEQVVFAVIKSAHFGLEKNADVPYDTMKTIFTLINRTFLENLTEVNMSEIQDIIRGVPNELWVYKMQSMVYLWAKYKSIANSTAKGEEAVRDQQAMAREWKSPCFHWVAKQAFDELVAISETEWKDHKDTFPALE
ncbi:hypothetical protein KR009_009965 [Drosophila setifemur]|nr:hypothetical protein KR009_009965 [Drosophila setifemur]